ncbi:hypothetical protein AX16_003119 [Volvariella volvacea WC 439]|nr:hypothetical protein AX16_003119 [Volvariella volvacea WC 439]
MSPAVVSASSSHVANSASAPSKGATAKKTRIIRRRGRARNAIESDDEIEREVGTDSEPEDDLSSTSSASTSDDSDTEPASEDVNSNDHSGIVVSSSSQALRNSRKSEESKVSVSKGLNGNGAVPFFNTSNNWSDMVADEGTKASSDLPVIDFADFNSQTVATAPEPQPRKSKRAARKRQQEAAKSSVPPKTEQQEPAQQPQPPQPEEEEEEPKDSSESKPQSEDPGSRHPSRAPQFKRPIGQTARQAYQQRLESDPSYVPTVGGFWGHDDRLLDKDLRSLSGWWRGKWQGRGRGFASRGRGRGGFVGSQGREFDEQQPENLPAIEKQWTHDGFEEMKRKEERNTSRRKRSEERKREQQDQQQQTQSPQSPANTPSRGGAPFARGRGGLTRGSHHGRPRHGSPLAQPGRVWFVMKPELMWTKQHEGFLHHEHPKNRQAPSYRVKLPGKSAEVVPSKAKVKDTTPSKAAVPQDVQPPITAEDKNIVVRLPTRTQSQLSQPAEPEPVTTVEEPPIEDVFRVRPELAPKDIIPLSVTSSSSSTNTPSFSAPSAHSSGTSPSLPDPAIRSQLEQLTIEPSKSDPIRRAQTEEAVLRNPSSITPTSSSAPQSEETSADRPSLPPLQTVFTPPPVAQPSPAYGSPYGYPHLPPGVALNQHGMPYELATGRPVYLQMPHLYTPRPMMHSPHSSISFSPGHMHHPSVEYMPPMPTHTPINGYAEPPMFTLPRPSARIEIRAPDENYDGKSKKTASSSAPHKPSGLRTTASTYAPANVADTTPKAEDAYPSLSSGNADVAEAPTYPTLGPSEHMDDHAMHQRQHADPSMMPYPAYSNYYYPDAYGYNPYMDMSQVYDGYSLDPNAPQGTIYPGY